MLAEELETGELATLARLIMRESDRIDELIQKFGQPELELHEADIYPLLDEALSPVRDGVITAGALRNRYAMLPGVKGSSIKAGMAVTLDLPDGERVVTQLAAGRRLRWRGWAQVYDAAGAQPGDTLRYVAVAPGRYTVRVAPQR